MVIVTPAPAPLDPGVVSLYFTKDPLFANLPVIVFYGPSTTTNSTQNSSRIQAHVYTLGGFQSFPRLTIAPTSPLYGAVHHLPEDKQGDEICRGLAVSLLKYFVEMPKAVKSALVEMAAIGRPDGTAPAMFDEMHAGDLAAKMVRVENAAEVASCVASALAEQSLSWTDVDVILPFKSIARIEPSDDPDDQFLYADDGRPMIDYGRNEVLVKLFGSPTFFPTSKLKRAPSKPTAVSKSRVLAKAQKESLRREMCELLDTEQRYVGKLYDLVHSVAVEFCRKVDTKPYQSTTPSERAMQKLFPQSLNDILDTNTAFMNNVRTLLEQSENEAVSDIGSTTEQNPEDNIIAARLKPKDLIAVEAFAKVLLEWIPKFREPYQAYLRASSEFPRILNDFLRDSASHFSQQIHATGEQRLRSWLIEPVQRLPRYSLFLDNMANQLPASHPAMGKFLRAKDMITDICALDGDQTADQKMTINRLRELIQNWPETLSPKGRLITAVDAAELKSPYRVTSIPKEGQPSIMLLFPDSYVVIRKADSSSLSARGLLAEVDRPASQSVSNSGGGAATPRGLTFGFSFQIQETRFTESNNGRLIQMVCVRRSDFVDRSRLANGHKYYAVTRVFALLGSYEGKAARWNEEVGRARIEERFPEMMRESDKWTLRSISPSSDSLGILAAIFENDYMGEEGKFRTSHGRIKVIIDQGKEERRSSSGNWRDRAVEITIRIFTLENDQYQLEFEGFFGGFASTDRVSSKDFVAVFLKRLSNLQRLHHQPQTAESAQAHICFHQKVVETLPMRPTSDESQPRRFRPVSPVKAFSNFLSNSGKELSNLTKQQRPAGPLDAPLMPPPTRSNSQRRQSDEVSSKVTMIGTGSLDGKDSLGHLEATFTAYIVSLRSRSGNVVGKVLRGRASADELLVNELYNTLVEDPARIQAAAEVSVDVLFAAFEKFLNKGWQDRMGPVLGAQNLRNMQSVLDSSRDGQTVERFKVLLTEMSPQNRRAFTAMIKLLSDLLDASGNDGDRGALIATFAEALVVEGNPHSYVSFLDHLVEEFDVLFDESAPNDIFGPTADSLKRTRSINTGSLSSNASSIRKRFGFGNLSRENSNKESESRVGQVWRSLSKKSSAEADSQPPSLSKSFLSRSRSTDTDNRKQIPSRPVSQDSLKAPTLEESRSRPGSGHNTLSNLTTIGEANAEPYTPAPRRKRRSSLSDLIALQSSGVTSFHSPSPLRNLPEDSIKPFQAARANQRTPSPTKSGIPSPSTGSPNRKENSPLWSRSTLTERAVNRKTDEVVITSLSPKKRDSGQSGIPAPKHGLHERTNSSNPPNLSPTKSPTKSPQKLRIQSPQKVGSLFMCNHSLKQY